jgi:hypothetical protein
MFDKLLRNICSAAHLFWVVAMFTIVYKALIVLSGVFTSSFGSILADVIGLLWDVFWVFIATSTIKKLCDNKYKNGAYVASLIFLFLWFKYDMSSPIDLNMD